MSNIFAGKKAAAEKVEDDFLGGGGALDTDIYTATIKTAYIGKASASDARNVTLLLDVNGREVRQQIWVSNRQGEVTYKDKNSGELKNLPGFNQINSLCMLVCSKEMGDMDVEELTVKLYDFDAKKELPQAVDCFTELHGEKVQIALQRQTVDKTALDQNTGKYEPTGETRDINEIVKFFPEDKLVTISDVAEFVKGLGGNFDDVLENGEIHKAIANMDESNSNYAEKWLERNKGQTYDKSSGKKAEGKSFGGGSKAAAGGESKAKAKTSLFDD
jgi:hypothetical protein